MMTIPCLLVLAVAATSCGDATDGSSDSTAPGSRPANAAGASASGGPAGTSANETPEAAFLTLRTALEDGDYPRFVDQLTPQAQEQFAGLTVVMASMMVAMGDAMAGMAQGMAEGLGDKDGAAAGTKVKEQMSGNTKSLSDLLARNGVDPKKIDPMAAATAMSGKDGVNGDALAKLASGIDDKRGFVAEAFTILGGGDGPGAKPPKVAGSLESVVIDGDTARGKLLKEGSDESQDIGFRRIAGSWRVELPLPNGR